MTGVNGSGALTDAESADLTERVERFRASWSPNASTNLSWSLPAPGARHRRVVLVQIILTDMERRAAAGIPFRVERYINLFPDELSTNDAPAELLVAEYRLRHRYTDKPPLSEYERWFPAQYPEIAEALRREPPPARPGTGEATPVISVHPADVPAGTLLDSRGRPQAVAPSVAVSSDVLPSDTPYRLIRRLGAGAFGEVFEARAPGEIPVAVKRIMRSVDHPASKSERDALEAIKRLSHPFLLKTNAYWILDDRLVIVMELADGSLSDRIAHHQGEGRTGVPPEELLPLFEQAGEALDYLHSENVSHRDIKPENILISKGYAKVADFGLARPQEHTLTVVGNTVGTPAYMAPEMWQQKVSLHSDQYSLAATYVRARLGRTLYSTTVLIEMANCHVHDTPDLNPLPAAEQRVLLKALAKNPDHRYESCLAFAEALRAAVFPPPEPPPAPATGGRRSGVLLTAVVACVVAVVVTVATVLLIPRDDKTQQPVEKPPAEKEPEKQPVAAPKPEKPLATVDGWTAEPGEPRTIGDKRYPLKLSRTVGAEKMVAVLIYPTNNRGPREPFYVLEHKITNKVFRSVWNDIATQPQVAELPSTLIKGKWKYDESGKVELDIDNVARDWPVLGVTVPEAILVAEALSGRLLSFEQWAKAAGLYEDGAMTGPAGTPLTSEQGATPETRQGVFHSRYLALELSKPLSVKDERAKGDKSSWGIYQLVSNGQEWLGYDSERMQLTLNPRPARDPFATVVGRAYHDKVIDSAEELRAGSMGSYAWNDVKGEARNGFRIVLEPR